MAKLIKDGLAGGQFILNDKIFDTINKISYADGTIVSGWFVCALCQEVLNDDSSEKILHDHIAVCGKPQGNDLSYFNHLNLISVF